MALLQITEPGESAAPHQHRLAVGIDLGTTNSCVAIMVSSYFDLKLNLLTHSISPAHQLLATETFSTKYASPNYYFLCCFIQATFV